MLLVLRPGRAVPSTVVAAVNPEQLDSGSGLRARESRIRRRRALVGALIALGVIAAAAAGLGALRGSSAVDPAAVASPVAASALDLGTRPPDRVIARAGLVEFHLPVDRQRIALTLFRSVDNPDAVGLQPASTWKHTTASRNGAGPQTAGLDIAAPPETIVYAPVDGTIESVTDYVVAGRRAGYQIDISPEAQSDVIVRVRHIEGIPVDRRAGSVCGGAAGFDRPTVGQFVTAGVTCIGEIRDATDLLDVARPEIAKYVSGSGSHVHMEVLRVGS